MSTSRSRRTRAAALASAAGLFLAGVAGCSSSGAGSDGSGGGGGGSAGPLRIVVNPAAPPSLPLIAEQIGAFEDEGLDVEISTQPTTAITTFAPALGRQYDIAWGTPGDVIAASAQGIDIQIVAGAYQDTEESQQGQVFAAGSSDITSLADLEGKRVATPSLSGTLYLALRTSLADEGVDPEDVDLVEVPFTNMLDQLNAGRVDAIALVQPFIGGARAAGHTALGDPFLSVASPALAGMYIADRSWAGENPDTVESFIAALDAARTWTDDHQDETRTAIATALDLPPAVMAEVPLPEWDTTVTAELLAPWIEAVESAGQVTGDLPEPADLVYGS